MRTLEVRMRLAPCAAGVAILLAMWCPPVAAQSAPVQPSFDVTSPNGLFTVRATKAPLSDVVGEVARLAGVELIGREELTGTISADFKDLPARQALDTLLAGVNYILQERTAPGGAAPRLVLSVHSMGGGPLAPATLSGPLLIPALNALVAAEMSDIEDDKAVQDEEHDPDIDDDIREEKLVVATLSAEGAFDPKASVPSLLKLLKSPYDQVRAEALKALAASPRPTATVLAAAMRALEDEALEVRTAAVELLGRDTGHETLATVGIKLEKESDRDFRISAFRVLALRGEPESAVHVRAVMNEKGLDEDLRLVAQQLTAELDRRERARQANAKPK